MCSTEDDLRRIEAAKDHEIVTVSAKFVRRRVCVVNNTERKPTAWLHVLDNTDGLKENEPIRLLTFSPRHPFGSPGENYSEEYSVTSTPLFASEVEPDG